MSKVQSNVQTTYVSKTFKGEVMDTYQEEWEYLLSTNPYKVARLQRGITQKELASSMGVSTQIIYRHENGLVNTPIPSLNEELSNLLAEINVVVTTQELSHQYAVWVLNMRREVRSILHAGGYTGALSDLMFGPRVDVNHFRAEHPFTTFMNNLTWAVGIQIGIAPDLLKSQQLFNRLLCLHPKVVQDYLKSGRNGINGVLRIALSDIGISDRTISLLVIEVVKWNERIRSLK